MKLLRVAASAAVILSLAASVQAGEIRPDCDAEKVAKNAALEATVGVSGRCTADRAVENAKDNVNDRVDDARDGVADHVDDKAHIHLWHAVPMVLGALLSQYPGQSADG